MVYFTEIKCSALSVQIPMDVDLRTLINSSKNQIKHSYLTSSIFMICLYYYISHINARR